VDYLRGGGASTTLNCGYGHGYSVREVLRMVEQVHGQALQITEEQRREGDPPTLVARADRIRQLLGWRPHHDDLETIVTTQLAWERTLQARPELCRN
jgi:UDP-glucose 4-epimerase